MSAFDFSRALHLLGQSAVIEKEKKLLVHWKAELVKTRGDLEDAMLECRDTDSNGNRKLVLRRRVYYKEAFHTYHTRRERHQSVLAELTDDINYGVTYLLGVPLTCK